MGRFLKFIGFLVVLILILSFISCTVGIVKLMKPESQLTDHSILFLKLDTAIMDGERFLKDLKKYREMSEVKGVLVQINSPGGVVGPSQEICAELKKTRDVYKKPVVASGLGVVASGAYYAAVAADKIIVNPGTLIGSIGVIMEFANLEKLYDWAKIKRYAITTGAYKDTGAEYREMREDEKKLVKVMMEEVLMQFKTAIAEGRKMTVDQVTPYADGRVFTGEGAVKIGLADQVGTLSDAVKVIGGMTGLGDKPELFEPPKEHESVMDFLMTGEAKEKLDLANTIKNQLRMHGQPLFLMPGAFIE